ncbi:MAG: hypothetical protein IKS64_01285, partial [Muribaculaceae bacterium]|nr:hypothetical protein [Muribaculaceae bacterium]
MRQFVKIWILVVAMVMGGALPPQVMGDNEVTSQWCAQAKSKKKNKKKSPKKKKSKKKSVKSVSSVKRATASPLVNVPTIGKTAKTNVVPQQN